MALEKHRVLSIKKFRLVDVNKMAQHLVCRNYGKTCLELSYLAWAVVNYSKRDASNYSAKTHSDTPLLSFFWLNESITPSRFRQAFDQPFTSNNIAISLNEVGLQLSFPQQPFVISATRIGLLAVLFEIIISLAPEKLAFIEETLQSTKEDSVQAIKRISSDLQKQIYQFLSEHLVPAQQQRRFRYINQWLALKGDNSTKTNLLSDEVIFSFWQDAAQDETSPGYKLYASAFNDIIETHQAMRQAKQALALDNARTIGFDIEGGEYSPDVIDKLVFDETSTIQDYAWLCQMPKFLTKAQWHFIEPLIQNQSYINYLPLSFARLIVFGQWQASIVQAKRKSLSSLQEKLTGMPEQSYIDYQKNLIKQSKILSQVMLAITYVFYRQQDSRFLGFILVFLPEELSQQLQKLIKEAVSQLNQTEQTSLDFSSRKLNKILFTQSQNLLKESLEFNRILKTTKTAFNRNNKEGFQHLPDSDNLEPYHDGYDALTRCQRIIQTYTAQLTSHWNVSQDCQSNYCSDVSIFKGMFEKLYGEAND